jgi:hypothetical protein
MDMSMLAERTTSLEGNWCKGTRSDPIHSIENLVAYKPEIRYIPDVPAELDLLPRPSQLADSHSAILPSNNNPRTIGRESKAVDSALESTWRG